MVLESILVCLPFSLLFFSQKELGTMVVMNNVIHLDTSVWLPRFYKDHTMCYQEVDYSLCLPQSYRRAQDTSHHTVQVPPQEGQDQA